MIYDINSKAFLKFLKPKKPKKCAICYEELCTECPECLKGTADLPCPCADKICNKCYVHSAITTMQPCTKLGCNCGKAMWKCPLARHQVTLHAAEIRWIEGTNRHHNIA